jgi:hypothetical protein
MLLADALDCKEAASVTVPPFDTAVGEAVAEVTWKLANAGKERDVSIAPQSNGCQPMCPESIRSLLRQNSF